MIFKNKETRLNLKTQSCFLYIQKQESEENEMTKTIYQPHYWHYLKGDFLNRIHAPLRKVLPTLTQRIKELFDYKG